MDFQNIKILAKANYEFKFICPPAKAGGNTAGGNANGNNSNRGNTNGNLNRNVALAHSNNVEITKLALAK